MAPSHNPQCLLIQCHTVRPASLLGLRAASLPPSARPISSPARPETCVFLVTLLFYETRTHAHTHAHRCAHARTHILRTHPEKYGLCLKTQQNQNRRRQLTLSCGRDTLAPVRSRAASGCAERAAPPSPPAALSLPLLLCVVCVISPPDLPPIKRFFCCLITKLFRSRLLRK